MRSFFRRLKYFLFVPRGITAEPKNPDSVISDLFLIRNDSNWKTEFELLNIRGLIEGDNAVLENDTSNFWFFDEVGRKLGEKCIELLGVGRQTVKLRDLLTGPLEQARTFAVFHNQTVPWLALERSFLADRGYAGFEFSNIGLKGYVHGNLDSIARSANHIEMLGKSGIPIRAYTVQHQLTGPATYEFFFTNPTNKTQNLKALVKTGGGRFIKLGTMKLKPRGSGQFTVKVDENETKRFQMKSRLFLGRPVVFRTTHESMDVFHG